MRTVSYISICIGFACILCIPSGASEAQNLDRAMGAARVKAIHDCSVASVKYPEYVWGNVKLYVYRACMAAHGQPE